MDIQTRKIAFVQEFLKLQSEKKISQLENILRTKEDTQFESMSMEEFDKRIDKSLSDFQGLSLSKRPSLSKK